MKTLTAIMITLLCTNSPAIAQDEDSLAYAKPKYRVPPIMPPMAETSGYCCMLLDVSKYGNPKNIRASYCTEDYFEGSLDCLNTTL